MVTKSIISKRIKEARLEANLSQKQLGIAAGIDEFGASARMNQYETGKHTPNFDMIQRIADVLNLPASYFYTADNELGNLLKIFSRLPLQKQRKLLSFLKKLS